jgi:hypothetical protein
MDPFAKGFLYETLKANIQLFRLGATEVNPKCGNPSKNVMAGDIKAISEFIGDNEVTDQCLDKWYQYVEEINNG